MSHHSKNNHLVTPTRTSFRRYSLADTRLVTPTKQTQYNAHVSTKIDSRSPGFSTRIVKYHEEKEKSTPIHQNKYDKLGIFPIVHFFKKDLPNLKRRNSENSSPQMNSAELSRFNSPEHNRLLLEKIIKSTPSKDNSEANTKSVLDALKEISRKRIHSSEEEFILKDDSKRKHMDYEIEGTSRKKMKQTLEMESPSRYSSINELIASHSSMDGYLVEESHKKEESCPVVPQPKPIIQYVTVETQTLPPPEEVPKTPPTQKEEKENVCVKEVPELKLKKSSPVKIFNEKPLETMKRGKLVTLMSPLSKKDAEKSEDKTVTEKPLVSILSQNKSPHKSTKHVTFDIPDSETSTVTNVNLAKVTEISSPTIINSVTSTSTAITTPIVSASVVESPPPISKSATNDTSSTSVPVSLQGFGNNISLGVPNLSTVSSTPTTTSSAPTSFLSPPNEVKTSVIQTTIPTLSQANEKKEIEPKFMFGKPTTSSETKINSLAPPSGNSPQKGGFKFELKENPVATTAFASSFEFKTTTVTSSPSLLDSTKSGNTLLQVTSSSAGVQQTPPMFGLKTTSGQGSTTTNFSDSSNKNFLLPTTPMFSFNKSQVASTTSSSPVILGSSVSSSNTFTQQPASSSLNFSNTQQSTSKPAMFSFGSSSTVTSTFAQSFTPSTASLPFEPKPTSCITTKPLNFLSPNTFSLTGQTPVTTTQSNTPFGTASVTFNKPSTSFSGFSATSTQVSASNVASPFTTNSPAFGGNNISNFGNDTKSAFGQNSGFSTNSAFGASNNFGTSASTLATTASAFGTTTPAFGTTTTPAFGTTTTPAFGTTTTPAFGATTASAFGTTTPAFGTTTASAFGTTTASAFGTTTTPAFGATAPAFGTTTTPAFGATAPAFGTPTTTPAFGATSSAFGTTTASAFGTTTAPAFGATTTAPTFGVTTNSAFGTTSGFGASTTKAPTFGTNTSSAFGINSNNSRLTSNPPGGTSNSTSAQNIFGAVATTSNNIFGSSNTFGSSSFGNNNFGNTQNTGFNDSKTMPAPSFGTSNNSAFGIATTTANFGTNSSPFTTTVSSGFSSNFGQSNNNAFTPAFGASSSFNSKPSEAPPNPFGGGNNSAFGGNSFGTNTQVTQSGVFAFGSNTANKPPVFSFGSSEPPKPSFNFTADNNSTAFGVANKGFGSNPSATFSPSMTPQFGLPTPAGAGMFNIGTGGSTTPNRSRTVHKVKRRT